MLKYILCGLLACAPLFAESLEAMDALVREAGSLDAFLDGADLRDRYFAAMQKYYGADRVPRRKYDEIVDQLRELVKHVPELKTRLWETEGIGTPFSVTLEATSYGRRLDNAAWAKYHDAMVEGWRRDAGVMDLKKAKGVLAAFAKEAAAVGETARAQREFFVAKKADPQLRAAAAWLLHEKFRSEAMRDKMRGGDPNLILSTLNQFRQGLRASFARDGIDLGAAVSFLQERVPTQGELLAREEIFPPEMRATSRGNLVPAGRTEMTTYHFRPPPRRFHGIWKGLPLGECVGSSTAQRWATVALTGTQFYHVERETVDDEGAKKIHYEGFTQHVPLKSARGEIVASTDFGAPALARSVSWQSPAFDIPLSLPLYDLWLPEMKKRMPEGWKGLAVGDGDHINNAGVLRTVRQNPSYSGGTPLGDANGYVHVDGMAAAIAKRTAPDPHGYSGDMIFDARGGGGRLNLRMLGPSNSDILASPQYFDDLRKTFAATDLESKILHAETLRGALGTAAADTILHAIPGFFEVESLREARAWVKAIDSRRPSPFVTAYGLGSFAGLGLLLVTKIYGLQAVADYLPGSGAAMPILAAGMVAGMVDITHRVDRIAGYRHRLTEIRLTDVGRGKPRWGFAQHCRALWRTFF